MDVLKNRKAQIFDSIFSDEKKIKVECYDEFYKSDTTQLFSLLEKGNCEMKYDDLNESSSSSTKYNYLLSQKNKLKIVNI